MTNRFEFRWPSWIGVVARDLEAQRRFYREVLGLDEAASSDDWVGFDLGDGRMFELIAVDPASPQYDRPRVQTGFDVDDIHTARAALLEAGVEPLTDVEGGPESNGYWAYFRDPEGNVFEIKQPLGP
ncbi:MAG: VOC family protein [Acidimicrobiia bacterium]